MNKHETQLLNKLFEENMVLNAKQEHSAERVMELQKAMNMTLDALIELCYDADGFTFYKCIVEDDIKRGKLKEADAYFSGDTPFGTAVKELIVQHITEPHLTRTIKAVFATFNADDSKSEAGANHE